MNTNTTTPVTDDVHARAQSGARWFFWIAGLSMINSIANATGATFGFMAGLGMTQVVDGLVKAMNASPWVALPIDACIAGFFVGLGIWAMKSTKAYLAGMVIYALDSLAFAMVQDWLGFAFHGLVLFFLWGGFNARRAIDRAQTTSTTPTMERAA